MNTSKSEGYSIGRGAGRLYASFSRWQLAIISTAVIGVMYIFYLFGPQKIFDTTPTAQSLATVTMPAPIPLAAKEQDTQAAAVDTGTEWKYSKDVDAMTSKMSSSAMITSENSLDLNFPYKGSNYGRLVVRNHPKEGLGLIFMVEKGQIICNNYRGCPISIRFDDAPALQFTGNHPSDSSSNAIFINQASKFIAPAKKAKKILVQVTMYQAGSQVLEFKSTKPLEWPIK